jgi:hypothetical protein
MTTASQTQIIVEEVVRTPLTGRVSHRFVTLVPADQAASMLSRQMAEDVLEELDAQGLGQDLQALAENAGDERQDFHVYTRDELRYLDASEDLMDVGEMDVHPDVWNVAAKAGWLVDNEPSDVAGGEMEVSK